MSHLNQIIFEKSREVEEADLKRRSDENDFERRMAELKLHYDTLIGETKENLNQQFNIEREGQKKWHVSLQNPENKKKIEIFGFCFENCHQFFSKLSKKSDLLIFVKLNLLNISQFSSEPKLITNLKIY